VGFEHRAISIHGVIWSRSLQVTVILHQLKINPTVCMLLKCTVRLMYLYLHLLFMIRN